ncbi:hypothetical protein ACFE04_023952 [Oxalis oulophora]
MELFIDLISTVAFSLLFFFLLAKLFSSTDVHQLDDEAFEDHKVFDQTTHRDFNEVGTIVFNKPEKIEDLNDQIHKKIEGLNDQFEKIEALDETEIMVDHDNDDDDDDDDDWEGVEKTELHKVFGAVASKSNVDHLAMANLGSDLKLQLYALHKVATEGPCHHHSQPMALKLSARAKWNAWQQLGNMSPEEAMEQYINLLPRNIHGRMQDESDYAGDDKQASLDAGAGLYEKLESDYTTLLPNQQVA